MLIVFAAFFLVPLLWLLVAPTKTDRQLLLDAPFAFGSLSTLVDNWNGLIAYQGGLLWTWIGNSAWRKPITEASSAVALTISSAGMSSTISE